MCQYTAPVQNILYSICTMYINERMIQLTTPGHTLSHHYNRNKASINCPSDCLFKSRQ